MELMNRKGQVLFVDDTAPNFTALLQKAIAQHIDLNDADFSNREIENLEIKNMHLSRLRLDNTRFKNVKFRNVKFENCIVIKTDFSKTDFLDCKLKDCRFYQNIFSYCEMKRTYLDRTTISDAYFRHFLFHECHFRDSRFAHNFLECEASYTEDEHKEFGFQGVNFIKSKVIGNHFKSVLINICQFTDSVFRSNKLKVSKILNSNFTDTDVSRSSFYKTTLSETHFKYAQISDVRIYESIFNDCKFNIEGMIDIVSTKTTYTSCHFLPYAEDADQLTFECSVLEKNTFRGCAFHHVAFNACSLDYSDFRHSNLKKCTLEGCTLYDTKLNLDQGITFTDCHFIEARAALPPRQEEPSRAPNALSADNEDHDMDED